jgi:hypothetical protein
MPAKRLLAVLVVAAWASTGHAASADQRAVDWGPEEPKTPADILLVCRFSYQGIPGDHPGNPDTVQVWSKERVLKKGPFTFHAEIEPTIIRWYLYNGDKNHENGNINRVTGEADLSITIESGEAYYKGSCERAVPKF